MAATYSASQPNQVQVTDGTISVIAGSGIVGPQGPAGGVQADYGAFYSTATQTNAGATVANVMTFDVTSAASGVSLVSNSRMTVSSSGVYNLQFSAQLDKTDSGDDVIDVWLNVDGVPVDHTNTRVTLHGNAAKDVAAWNYLIDLNAGQYCELVWHSIDLDLRLLAEAAGTSPTRPAVPSVIATIYKVSG